MFSVFCTNTFGQTDSTNIWRPYILSTHPLGIFVSRINHNFNNHSTNKFQASFTLNRGNVWLPEVTSYHLLNKEDQEIYSKIPWHQREGKFYSNPVPHQKEVLRADGVYNSYYLQIFTPLSKKMDLAISIKGNQISKGEVPFSLLTSDQALEWFHSNIAGGEDPFGRKLDQFDQNYLFYQDINGGIIDIDNSKLFLTEFSVDAYHYPKITFLKKHQMNLNIGVHAAGAFIKNKMNLDLGTATTINKTFYSSNKWSITAGFAGSVLVPSIIKVTDVTINQYKGLFSFENHWNFIRKLKANRLLIYSINYHLQSSYQSKKQLNNMVIGGDRVSSHWHLASSSLHAGNQGWSFILSLKNNSFTYSTYFREDFWVDNSPDFQIGWGISYSR